jgi:glycosyltransferase involved in cell wall biosynthesis
MSAQHAPAISVCIPAYQGADHLGAAIESVLAQRFADFELLIIDDCSSDATADVVRRYDDPRLCYSRNPRNLGAEGNWNRCLDMARGRYVKILPQDDLIAPACLERQFALLEQDTQQRLALTFCARSIIDAHGRIILQRGYAAPDGSAIAAGALVRKCLRRGTNLVGEPGSVLFRRQLALRVGPFDASIPYVIDLDYWTRLLQHGDAGYVAAPLASFRLSRGSWSVAIGARQHLEFRRFMRKLAANPNFPVGRGDVLLGHAMAMLNNALRLAFYRLVL